MHEEERRQTPKGCTRKRDKRHRKGVDKEERRKILKGWTRTLTGWTTKGWVRKREERY